MNAMMKLIFNVLVAGFAVLGTFGCGSDPSLSGGVPAVAQQPIINGEACAETDHPSAVALITDAEISIPFLGAQTIRQATCTGTLIAPDVVLTAAHCLDPTLATFGYGEVHPAFTSQPRPNGRHGICKPGDS